MACGALLAPLALAAPAVTSAQTAAWYQTAAQKLTTQPGADASVARALLQARRADAAAAKPRDASAAGNRAALDLLDRAAKADPIAPDIAALQMWQCQRVAGCDVPAVAARLRKLAPGNALADWPALRVAQQAHDESQVTQVLQRVATARSFDGYRVNIISRVADALSAAGVPPFQGARSADNAVERKVANFATATMLVEADGFMPPFQYVTHACATTGAEFAARRHVCGRIGRLLEGGDTLIAVRIGLLLQRRTAMGAAEQARVLAAERQVDWQLAEYTKAAAKSGAAWIAAGWQAQREHGSELGGVRARLRQLRQPLQPPADWVDAAQALRQADARRRARGG